jgi:RNA polymerase sigma factor (sigma-70 family)
MSRGSLNTFVHNLCEQLSASSQAGLPDAALLDRWIAQRDEAAFELLLRRHGSMVLGVCRRMLHQEQDIEDAFQATFLLLLRKAAGIRQRHALGPWLHKVAIRVALRARNARTRQPEVVVEEVTAPLEKDELLWRDMRPVLDEEINGLPDRYRLPFVLCNLEGKTNQEAADALGCPVGTILSRLHWARGRLRTRLERRGVTIGVALLALLLEQRAAPAAIPAALIETSYRAVLSASSPTAVALAQGVMRSMFLTKLKWTTIVLAVCCVLSLSAWKFAESAKAAPVPQQIPEKQEPPARPPSVDQPPPPRDWVLVPTPIKGRLVLIGRELREGEKAPDERIVMTLDDMTRRYYRLKEGDRVEKGELLGRLDDRLARKEFEIKKAKIQAAEADFIASEKTRDEAKTRFDRIKRLLATGTVPMEEYNAAKLTWDRYIEEVKARKASLVVAQLEMEQAQILLQMCEIRSPVRGIIQAIQKKQGEAVTELEGVFRIKVEEK